MIRKSMVTIAALLIVAAPVMARDMEKFEETVPGDSKVREVRLESDFGVGNIDLVTHEGGDLIICKAYYDADKIEIEFGYEPDGDIAEIFIGTEQFRRHSDIDTEDNEWFISLSRDYEWSISLDIGAADVDLDLTELPLARLNLDLGAGDMRMVFKEYNPLQRCKIDIDAGAGELKAFGLGFANFEYCNFDGGAGDFLLNFKGLKNGRRSIEVDIGVGEATLELPDDFPLRLETSDGWLSSVDIERGHIDRMRDGIYESDDYGESDNGLDVEVDVGIGEAHIEWIH